MNNDTKRKFIQQFAGNGNTNFSNGNSILQDKESIYQGFNSGYKGRTCNTCGGGTI